MNILPIVFAFLVIFSLLTAGFMREHIQSSFAEMTVNGLQRTERSALNGIVERQYNNIKKKSLPSTPVEHKVASEMQLPKQNSERIIKRDGLPPLECSKLNLKPLIELQTDPRSHPLYAIAARLLGVLYKDLFSHKGEEYEILDALLKIKEADDIADFYVDIDNDSLIYQMIKGTNGYDVKARKGIPPLGDFFCIGKSGTIYFAFASSALVEAIFGKKMALKIFQEEEKKGSTLTKEELGLIFAQQESERLLPIEPHLNFSRKPSKRLIIGRKDKKSGLIVRKKV